MADNSGNGLNGKGNGHDKKDNIIDIRTLANRDKKRREETAQKESFFNTAEPMINLPIGVKYMLGLFVGIHILTYYIVPQNIEYWVIYNLGFVPAHFTNLENFTILSLATPFTHMFIHGGLLHLAINALMLTAFGSGIEKWIGSKRMIIFFILCGFFGAATHFAFNPFSPNPVIGASGGISGLFAAAFVMIQRQQHGMFLGKINLLPFIIVWIAVSVLFGMMGSPDGSSIAWAAHVGGFLGGFAVLKLMRI